MQQQAYQYQPQVQQLPHVPTNSFIVSPSSSTAQDPFATVLNADGTDAWPSYNEQAQLFTPNDNSAEMIGLLKSLAEEIATLHAKVDKIDNKIDNLATNGFVAAHSSSITAVVELDDANIDLIDSSEKLEELEQKLKTDSSFRTDLVSVISFHDFVCVLHGNTLIVSFFSSLKN